MFVRSADETLGSRTHIANNTAATIVIVVAAAAADAKEAEKKR